MRKSESLLLRARHLEERGDWLGAMKLFLQAADVARAEKAPVIRVTAYFSLADFLMERLGEYSFALKVLGKIYRENLTGTRSRLGWRALRAVRLMRDWSKLPPYARYTLHHSRLERRPGSRIRALREISLSLLTGGSGGALYVAARTLQHGVRLRMRHLIPLLRADMAAALALEGRIREAHTMMGRAISQALRMDHDPLLAEVYLRYALIKPHPWEELGLRLAHRLRNRRMMDEYHHLKQAFERHRARI